MCSEYESIVEIALKIHNIYQTIIVVILVIKLEAKR